MKVHKDHVRIAKKVGENEDGITLFIPKDENGVFNITEGDEFLTMMFVKNDGEGALTPWLPWEDES